MEKFDFLQFYSYLSYKSNKLHVNGFSIDELSCKEETPFFLFLLNRFQQNYEKMNAEISKHIPNILISYAVKANYLGRILDAANHVGMGLEVMSLFELKLAEKAKFQANKIIFNGPAKSEKELEYAIAFGITKINVDSLSELINIEKIAKDKGIIQPITIRIHPKLTEDTEKKLLIRKNSKLGIDYSRGVKLFEYSKKSPNLNPIGIHVHVGTNLTTHDFFEELLVFLSNYITELEDKLQVNIKEINLGGGLASNSTLEANGFSFDRFGEQISNHIKEIENKLIIFEPGRYLIEDSFIALTKVIRTKKSWGRKWAFTDIGANSLIPMRYTHYKILPANNKGKDQYTNIGGPLCLPVDVLTNEAVDFIIEEKDFLAVLNCGAYTISMSEQFGYPRPAIYELTENGTLKLLKAEDKLDQMIEAEFNYRK
ncbi:MAG: hypothetical protein KAS63_00290 [Candidatus Heimdallarchaeota archaeon]|nr:hypothetical protein [Candidatus Heimdallarchaeota archaeon]MCK4953781.1 hypothetical protein [Candidatus Heimdallarchaeota archaeon]